MFFWNSPAFSMIQQMLAIWSLVPLPFLNPAWTFGSSQFTYCWSLGNFEPFLKPAWTSGSSQFTYCWSLGNFEHYITSVWDECKCLVVEHSLALPFFGTGVKTDLFQSCGHCWVFQICWHIECSTFTASSFRIWNSSIRIPSLPLALFIVMLSKAHLTSHSRMCGSRWVITPSWLSG